MTFKTWIKEFRGHDSAIGDLADDINRDKEFPSSKKFEKIAEYLISKRACSGAIDAFTKAFMQYFLEEN